MARDSIVLLPFLPSLPLPVFSLKLHPPQKYHCSNIQNGDVHCGTLEWAQCGSCVAARACCDLQLIRDFFKICRTPKIKSTRMRRRGGLVNRRCACNFRYDFGRGGQISSAVTIAGYLSICETLNEDDYRVKDSETWVSLNDNERATTLKWSFIHKSSSPLQITSIPEESNAE